MAGAGCHYSLVVPNLINGQSYAFRVSAENRDGEGAYASSSSASPSGLPDVPSGFSAVDAGTGGLVILSVDALNAASGGANVHPSDEGSAFNYFQIYRDGEAWEGMPDLTFPYGNNLVNGQSYTFALASITVVPSMRPDVVTGLAAVHGDSQAALSWTQLSIAPSENASDEGSAITSYIIQMSHMGGSFSTVATISASSSSYVKTGLSNGDSYQLRISASNANGTSDVSSPVSITPSTSPSCVRNVHIVGNASELQIIWDAPLALANGDPSGGLAYLYSLEVADASQGIAYTASGLSTTYVEVQT